MHDRYTFAIDGKTTSSNTPSSTASFASPLLTTADGAAPNYSPNSIATAPKPDASFADPTWKLGETIIDRYDSAVDHDDFTQAGNLFRMFDNPHRERLTKRIAGVLKQARTEVQMRQLCHFFRADEDYGSRVAKHLGIDVSSVLGDAKYGAGGTSPAHPATGASAVATAGKVLT